MTKFENFIVTHQPFKFLLKRSEDVILPGFNGLCLYDVLKFFVRHVGQNNLRDRASAIAFNFIMALPATAIFLFTLIPYFPVARNMQDELFKFIEEVMPNTESRSLIMTTMLDLFNKPKTGLLSIGFILALFYSSNAMFGIVRTFDAALPNKRKINMFRKRLRAIKLTIVLILLIIATILLSIGQGNLFVKILGHEVEKSFWTELLRWAITVALFLFSIAYIYKYAPSVYKRWKLISPGAIFATFLMIFTTWLFSIWAQNFSTYNRIYGSIGALLIIMLLIYINSWMLLIGFHLNVSISYLKSKQEERNKANDLNVNASLKTT